METELSPWLRVRRKGIGSSDSASILGVSPFKSAYTLWLEKTGLMPTPPLTSEAVEWGNRLEEAVVDAYFQKTGRSRVPVEAWPDLLPSVELLELPHEGTVKHLVRSREHPWLMATPDFLTEQWTPPTTPGIHAALQGIGIGEAKTTNASMKKDWKGGPPLAYQIQGQHTMLVTGLKWCAYPVLFGGQHFEIHDVPRNSTWGEWAMLKLVEFWEVNVEQKIAPPLDGSKSTRQSIEFLHPRDDGSTVDLPIELGALDELRQELTENAKLASKEADRIANLIKSAIGDATFGVLPDSGVTFMYKWYDGARGQYRALYRKKAKITRKQPKRLVLDMPEELI